MSRLSILVLFVALFATAFRPLNADDISGTWKRTKMTLVDASGKTTDMIAMMAKSMPCSKDISYTFLGDGHMKTNIPDACGSFKKTVERMNAGGRWVQNGRKVTVTTTSQDLPPSTYDLIVQGNTMTWVFNYADNPKTPNPTKAQRMTITYQKV